jgi:hypothetical protein
MGLIKKRTISKDRRGLYRKESRRIKERRRMSKCECCGEIDYGFSGRLGVIGYSLVVGAFGYAIGFVIGHDTLYFIAPALIIVGVLLWLPMYLDNARLEREEE